MAHKKVINFFSLSLFLSHSTYNHSLFFLSTPFSIFPFMGICIPRRSQHLPARRKLVLVGDGGCGKTSLLNVFTRGYFPQVNYYPSAAAVISLKKRETYTYKHKHTYSSTFQCFLQRHMNLPYLKTMCMT